MILLIRRSTPHGPFEILTHRWPEWYLVCHKIFKAEFQAEYRAKMIAENQFSTTMG